MIIEATLAKKLATVMISTSRFLMCASSWAMTPSSSAGESVFMMPVVAHTVALFCDRPSANALGIGVSATAIFGLGRSAWMQSRSIIACRPGACSGETSLAPIEASASLSEVNSCSSARPPMTTAMMAAPAPAASSAPAKATYSRPSRNMVDQHPELEAAIALEDCLGSRHVKRSVGKGCTIPCTPRETGRDRRRPRATVLPLAAPESPA